MLEIYLEGIFPGDWIIINQIQEASIDYHKMWNVRHQVSAFLPWVCLILHSWLTYI